MDEDYSLKTVKEVYSPAGKSSFLYNLMSAFKIESWLRKKMVKLAGLKMGGFVLDIACGTGLNFKHIMKAIGSTGRLVGVDYIDEMCAASKKLAEKKAWKNVDIIVDDAAKLKLKPNSFDAVVSTIGFSCIPDHVSALKNAKACLKKGKKLVIIDSGYFSRKYSFLNPLIDFIRWKKSYDPGKDLVSDVRNIFGNVKLKRYCFGSTYIAVAVKR